MNKLLVALFVAVIALPLAATVAGRDGADPQAENRELAAFPRVDGSWESLRRFPAGLGAWFEDHFAFRSTLVRWSAESRLFGLDTAPTPTVIKGRNGWFFYGEDGSIEDYTSSNPLSADELANWRAALSRARHHQLADDRVLADAAGIDDDHVALLRAVERLVHEQVVARRGLHRIGRTGELAFPVHRPQLRPTGVEALHAVGEMRRHHLCELGHEPRVGAPGNVEDAHRRTHRFAPLITGVARSAGGRQNKVLMISPSVL